MTSTRSLTLNGIKREKNFIAVIDKGYQRYVNEEWPIYDPERPEMSLIGFVRREMEELNVAMDLLLVNVISHLTLSEWSHLSNEALLKRVQMAMREVGDVSNTLDYLFDALDKVERELR